MISDQLKIEIMQHFINGGEIESRDIHDAGVWYDNTSPSWNWGNVDYRIKPVMEVENAYRKKVMNHYNSGGKIMFKYTHEDDDSWRMVLLGPNWDWSIFDYKIKSEEVIQKDDNIRYLFAYKRKNLMGQNYILATGLVKSEDEFRGLHGFDDDWSVVCVAEVKI